MDNMQNQNDVILDDAMNDDILLGWKTSESWPPILIASAANKGMLCQQPKTLGDVIDNPVGDVNTAALLGDAQPNCVKLCFQQG
jgi:hypothetical protein